MPSGWDNIAERLGGVLGRWTAFTALGSFIIYLLGYLALRFQLSTYGVATNLDVWDERYLFAGCRFLVYLVASVPNFLLIVIAVVAVLYLGSRLLPKNVREHLREQIVAWAARPNFISLLGTVLALSLIQFVMRKCFLFGNVLLAGKLPENEWINRILLADGGNRSLYFSSLVGGTMLTGVLLLLSIRMEVTTLLSKLLIATLVFLVAVEFLLLPINYGVLIASGQLPRLGKLPGEEQLAEGDRAWLVWDSKEAIVYLVRTASGERALVTIPRKEPKVKIVAYDPLSEVLAKSAGTLSQGGTQ